MTDSRATEAVKNWINGSWNEGGDQASGQSFDGPAARELFGYRPGRSSACHRGCTHGL